MTQPYNDTLEAYEDMSEQISTLQAQRDELLAALELIADQLQRAMSDDAQEVDFDGCAAMRDTARAAIRRARGE